MVGNAVTPSKRPTYHSKTHSATGVRTERIAAADSKVGGPVQHYPNSVAHVQAEDDSVSIDTVLRPASVQSSTVDMTSSVEQ